MPVHLRAREDRRLRSGHLWVFSNEIARVEGEYSAGDLVAVLSGDGRPVGSGIFNPHSLIAVRMTGSVDEPLDAEWFRSRVQRGLRLRRRLYPGLDSYRLLHSESDSVPGVVVDRYGEVCVVQIAALGMELRRELLFDALMEIEGVTGIVERNDTSLRSLEGLARTVSVVRGQASPQIITDGILRYRIDPLGGQKTGFYLDQRENRLAMRRYMSGGSVVLDLFCNSGGFALHATSSGVTRVVAVDSSADALAELDINRELNLLGPIDVRQGDVFDLLSEFESGREAFDVVIADPPPFARSKKHASAARRKYVELFTRSLALLSDEGVAFLATCSHHITRETFAEIVRESLSRSRRLGVILEERGAPPDHPVHPLMPETRYLHGAILQVREPRSRSRS